MKSKTLYLLMASTLIGFGSFAFGATNFDVAHDSIHRVEHLIDIGTITDDGYLTSFKNLTLEVLNPANEADKDALTGYPGPEDFA